VYSGSQREDLLIPNKRYEKEMKVAGVFKRLTLTRYLQTYVLFVLPPLGISFNSLRPRGRKRWRIK